VGKIIFPTSSLLVYPSSTMMKVMPMGKVGGPLGTTDQDTHSAMVEWLTQMAKAVSPLVVVCQHAVGHGEFALGALGYNKPHVRWIYDYGAWRKLAKAELLACYARRVGREGQVDLLILSHFDADHANGVQQLLAKVPSRRSKPSSRRTTKCPSRSSGRPIRKRSSPPPSGGTKCWKQSPSRKGHSLLR
jgi:glyoxylase-like metal-dependent hydrolase (beta-lactamase superfamily II)